MFLVKILWKDEKHKNYLFNDFEKALKKYKEIIHGGDSGILAVRIVTETVLMVTIDPFNKY